MTRKVKAIIIAALVTLASCKQSDPVYNKRIYTFGTLVDISIVNTPRDQAIEVTDKIIADFNFMHENWHAWKKTGDLAYTNKMFAQDKPFTIPPSIVPLIRESQKLVKLSDGLFNPAIGKLINLWGFHNDNPSCKSTPTEKEIKQLMTPFPDINDIDLNNPATYTSNHNIQLDFGGFAKGYAVDYAINYLKQVGIDNALVNAGGDLRAIGSRQGVPWRIAIRDPSGNHVMGSLEINGDESVFTSGNYERNYSCGDRFIHHIIDPRTGKPSIGAQSVTVIHSSAAFADAAATALLIAGPSEWEAIAKKMGLTQVLLIDDAGKYHMTKKMKQRLTLYDIPHQNH